MTMEFDPRTGFAQAEDKIGELLVPRKAADLTPPVKPKQANAPPVVSQCLMGVGFDTVYEDWERYTLEYPPGLVMLPGTVRCMSTCTSCNMQEICRNICEGRSFFGGRGVIKGHAP